MAWFNCLIYFQKNGKWVWHLKIIFSLFFIISVFWLHPEDEYKIKEFITVENTLIYVRALRGGEPVKNLKETDFELFENNQLQTITSCIEMSRKIGVSQLKGSIKDDSKEVLQKKRYFMLYFWICEPEVKYKAALDYFFDHIYSAGDEVHLVVEKSIFQISNPGDIAQAKKNLEDSIKSYTRNYEAEKMNRGRDFQRMCNELVELLYINPKNEKILELIDVKKTEIMNTCQWEWKALNYKYMKLNKIRLALLAEALKKVEMEKWILVFYQPVVFPLLDKNSDAFSGGGLSKKWAEEWDFKIKTPENLAHISDVCDLFVRTNTTTHLLLLDAKSVRENEERFFVNTGVSSEMEEAFRDICKNTGGKVVLGNKLDLSLSKAVEKEDVYYIVSYEPSVVEKKKRKIKIQAKDPSINVFHNKTLELEQRKPFSIENVAYQFPELKFSLKNYRKTQKNNKITGDIEVKLSVLNNSGEVNTVTKNIDAADDQTEVSIQLNLFVAGEHLVMIEAIDNCTKEKAAVNQKIVIKKDDVSVEAKPKKKSFTAANYSGNSLADIFSKLDRYCQRLKHASLHFFCQEKFEQDFISDEISKGGIEKMNRTIFVYDYQIIIEGESLKESRTLVYDQHKKVNIPNAPLKTRFFSKFSFFQPLLFFAKEHRHKYNYSIIKEHKYKGRNVYQVLVEPSEPKFQTEPHGIAWVDKDDGSVLRIKMDQSSIRGITHIEKKANRRGLELQISDEHFYLIEKKGLRFPSRTIISERYIRRFGPQKNQELELSTLYITYRDYRFFSVKTDVIDVDHE